MTISRIRGNAAQIGQQVARAAGKEQARAYFAPESLKNPILDYILDAILTLAVIGLYFGVGLAVYDDFNHPRKLMTDTDCMNKYGLIYPEDDIDAINADKFEGEQE